MGEVTNTGENVRFYKILLKEKIAIVRNEKDGNEYIQTEVGGLEGFFSKVELGSYKTREGEEVELVKIYLKDEDGEYCISTAWTSVSRSIINSFAGEEKLSKIKISVYGTPKGDRVRPSVSVRNNDQQTSWKYSIPEQKELIEEIKDKSGKVIKRDYTDLNNLLKGELDAINNKVDGEAMLDIEVPVTTEEASEEASEETAEGVLE